MKFAINQTVRLTLLDGSDSTGVIEDYAGGEYAVRTEDWRTKKWYKEDELQAIDDHPQKGSSQHMTKILTSERGETVTAPVLLSDLISLRDTTFTLPAHATREIDHAHVLNLAATNSEQWPPIKVVDTDEGLAVIDGYHRWEAKVRQAILQALHMEEDTPREQEKALKDVEPSHVQAIIEETQILAEIGVYRTEKDVAKAALTANLQHGMPPKSKARVLIAMELYDVTRGDEPEPSQADIARIVGISRAALNEYLKKREKAEAEAVSEGAEGEEAEAEAVSEDKEATKLLKKVQAMIAAMEDVSDKPVYREIISALLPVVIRGLYDLNGVDTKKAVEYIVQAFQNDDLITKDADVLFAVGKAIGQASKRVTAMLPPVQSELPATAPTEAVTTPEKAPA